jgi:Flp pilus assembly protein TadB
VLFSTIDPDIGRLLFRRTAGQIALLIAIGFEAVGLVIIRRLAIIEV